MSEYIVDLTDVEKRQFTWSIETLCNSVPVRGEIVRCRDCKHFAYADSEHDNNDWCAKHEHIAWSVNGFCAWAVKRKEGGE